MKKMREKSKRMRKMIDLLMAAVLCIGMFPISAKAQTNTITYLALGDSITTGYGLSNPSTEGFVAKFTTGIEGTDTTVDTDNEGVAGLTAKDLATALASGSYDSKIAEADVITITIGGNDLMAAFYECVATLYSSTYQTSCTSDNVKAWLSDAFNNSTQVGQIVAILSSETGAAELKTAISAAASECVENIESIVGLIHAANQDAVILLANQYNPYASLSNIIYANISTLFATAVQGFNTLLSASDTVITNCTIVDLYNANVSTNVDVSKMNFDFHPDAAGHTTIADEMKYIYDLATTYYTWEIPIELKVAISGSAAAPAQDFQVEILDFFGESYNLAAIGVKTDTMVDTVSTNGVATYTVNLTFTGNGIAWSNLGDGFYVRLVSGSAAGWLYDEMDYYVICEFDSGTQTNCTITINDGSEKEVDFAAFTCTYTGYTLNFETNGGSTLDSVSAATGTEIDLTDSAYTPTRAGYSFTGWYTDSKLTTAVDSVILDGDKTVYAGWEEITYTWEVPVEITVKNGGSVSAPEKNFALEVLVNGKTVDGVGTVEGIKMDPCSVTATGDGTFTQTVTLTGSYDAAKLVKENGFTIGLADDGEAGWSCDDTVYNVTVNFDWETGEMAYISVEESVQTQALLLQASSLTADPAVFTCTYTGYTLDFETNGGSEVDSVAAVTGTAIDLSAYTTTRSGYTFTGWYKDSELTTAVDSVTLDGDKTVYAGWKADTEADVNQYTLTFETNGGSAIDSVTVAEGTEIDLSDYVPTRSGYTFTGWYTDSALT
ncbi:MAG: InlB B-repeat-containing protein, partial [Clostridiales bacterium]|nr:InlB B-repeat-containing protein [Clostridiales bacterium]